MLQIFVRPQDLDLEPNLQHEPLSDPIANEWRHVFGPEGSDAPVSVHNDAHCYDVRLNEDASVDLPLKPGGTRTSTCSKATSQVATRPSTKQRPGSSSATTPSW